jgi:uncharacterized protein YijF (DUF1287 family)
MSAATNAIRRSCALLLFVGAIALLLSSCLSAGDQSRTLPTARTTVAPASSIAGKIVAGARRDVERGVRYDARYVVLKYPGGDVPADRGACTDLIVRALRSAGHDLQKLIHEDMRRRPRAYPRRDRKGPDPSIDHRRTPNHVAFLRRHGLTLPTATTGAARETWEAGDLVYWRLPNGMGHCGVVSDVRNGDGLPLVIHNIGGAAEEDCLTVWEITDHFRYPVPERR